MVHDSYQKIIPSIWDWIGFQVSTPLNIDRSGQEIYIVLVGPLMYPSADAYAGLTWQFQPLSKIY